VVLGVTPGADTVQGDIDVLDHVVAARHLRRSRSGAG